ncbi:MULTISPECIES: LuxR C-terminal-related transcriptional regulator [Deinococcus]|uniref:LuxR C-terminal-related transcriptional regulator n=1 Tax=Deinococcus rufus TaxID=2136097 RepID=A0ABV7ZF08_9DEIO|nr:LuxR C-terminal-related transcriptional regulator [Deinococcus sp. AB2017081]WQE94061.1 LuxR C-terminal-related transcriptional regulator [Deinococcus sp. AB2017081]
MTPPRLTRRQQQAHDLLQRGCSDKQIARRLRITPETVAGHCQAVYAALNVANRRALLARPVPSSAHHQLHALRDELAAELPRLPARPLSDPSILIRHVLARLDRVLAALES